VALGQQQVLRCGCHGCYGRSVSSLVVFHMLLLCVVVVRCGCLYYARCA
jgi:hypothetical protein